MFSFDTGSGLAAKNAWAQTAGNPRCNGCVDRREIRKGVVNFSRLQPKVRNRINDLAGVAARQVPFYVTLDGEGALRTVVTNGPLTLFAHCRVNDAGQDRVELIFTSSIDGWFAEDVGANEGFGPAAASEQAIVIDHSVATGTQDYSDDSDEGSAIAPDGSFIAVTGQATGLGLNIFGHNCVAVGTAFLVNGTL